MSRFPDELLTEIKSRLNLVELVGEYVRLTRRGNSHVGLCPFHSEKTPSFNVVPSRGFYHCFGCNTTGDGISFLMQVEGLSFGEAVRVLGRRAGVDVPEPVRTTPEEERERRQRNDRKETLQQVNEMACKFFEENLANPHDGSDARQYLSERGVGMETVRTHRLGYASTEWDALSMHLSGRGLEDAVISQSGLVRPRRSGKPGFLDLFRGRLITPIMDSHQRVIGFSGRLLPSVEREQERAVQEGRAEFKAPKYLNSPETALFHKGSALLGYGVAKEGIRRSGQAVVVEGNFDLLAMWEQGFRNVVAPMGTALTIEQAKVVARLARQVVLLYDCDDAGRKAAERAVPVLLQAGMKVRLCQLPDGHDPATFLGEQGGPALEKLVDDAQWAVEFIVHKHHPGPMASVEEKVAALHRVVPVIDVIGDPLERELYQRKAAELYGVQRRDLQSLSRGGSAGGGGAPVAQVGRNAPQHPGDAERPLQKTPRRGDGALVPDQTDRLLLRLVMEYPQFLDQVVKANAVAGIRNEQLADLLQMICSLGEEKLRCGCGEGGAELLQELLDSDVRQMAVRILAEIDETRLDINVACRMLNDSLVKLEKRKLERDPVLEQAIVEANKRNDEESLKKLLAKKFARARQRHLCTIAPGESDPRSRQ